MSGPGSPSDIGKSIAELRVRDEERRRRAARDRATRFKIAALGIALPYVARLPGVVVHGWPWFEQYWGFGTFLEIEELNAVAWGSVLAISFVTTDPAVLWTTVATVSLLLGYVHGTLDLLSRSTAGLALLFIPFYAISVAVYTALGAAIIAAIVRWIRGHLTKNSPRE